MEYSHKLFWDWFLKNQSTISKIDMKDGFIDELNTEVDKLGNFAWEFGGGKEKPFSFTISPEGNADLLEESREIISHAPVLNEWEFYYSRQPKEWKGYFDTILNGKIQRINISKWEYVLYQFDDSSLDIVVKPVPYIVNSENEIYGIVEMVLDSIVGEEERIRKLQNLEVVKEFDTESEGKKNLIVNLKKHLEKLA